MNMQILQKIMWSPEECCKADTKHSIVLSFSIFLIFINVFSNDTTVAIKSCFLTRFKSRVVLNGQNSTCVNVEAGVPQGSILRLLLFLIYIKGLSENLVSNPNDTFFFLSNIWKGFVSKELKQWFEQGK